MPGKVFIDTNLLNADIVVSTQVLNEFSNEKALSVQKKYGFSFSDCLIVASSLENNCSILFSEDLSSGQVIEKRLKIINPFSDFPPHHPSEISENKVSEPPKPFPKAKPRTKKKP
jgi:predicted nucleic acid-binding protein